MVRRWIHEEVNVLVEKVGENYDLLTSALSATKTKHMVEEKWKTIADAVNALDSSGRALHPVEKVKRKWFDRKSISTKSSSCLQKRTGEDRWWRQ